MSDCSSSSTIFCDLRARSLSVLTSMPGDGRGSRRRQHALALDLDHAGAAVAVRPQAGLVAQVRDLDAVRAWPPR
jgi:hypothetical protein